MLLRTYSNKNTDLQNLLVQPHIQNNTNFLAAVSCGDETLIRLLQQHIQIGMHVNCSNTYRGFKIHLQECAANFNRVAVIFCISASIA